jgi:hypothetical protein
MFRVWVDRLWVYLLWIRLASMMVLGINWLDTQLLQINQSLKMNKFVEHYHRRFFDLIFSVYRRRILEHYQVVLVLHRLQWI